MQQKLSDGLDQKREERVSKQTPSTSLIVDQFKRPRGLLGALAGWIMANRASNIERNRWTVELLSLQAGADVLEIGCGPGIGLEAVLEAARGTCVTGLDHSALMIAKAGRRHVAARKSGRLVLVQGEVKDLPSRHLYNAVFSCNVMQFVDNRRQSLEQILDRLKPDGLLATTFQPRGLCASAEEGRNWIGQFAEDLCQAGFRDVDVRERSFGNMPAFCALGVR
ncbi:MAG: class I SAM-dependent methyltransferase [Roseibium sp.]|uniref:class I SAM-dependent methyltransferase n=1 Tax=Roseibium sp. TaxID=1936156 RepID=UPI0026058259|nr:class I SAM-dependent methyltransferase [Roseibium sp.]MCV0427891.1 class I SAM-dependent methyltransferase [Roseibium sp.]